MDGIGHFNDYGLWSLGLEMGFFAMLCYAMLFGLARGSFVLVVLPVLVYYDSYAYDMT